MDVNNSINSCFDKDFLTAIKNRRERIAGLLNKQTNNANSVDTVSEIPKKTDKSETSFEKLVKNIKNSNLTIEEKKIQIHYAKYALMQMDPEQSKNFVKNIKTLIDLKSKNQSGQYNAVLNNSENNYSKDIENALKKLNELKKQISDENKSLESSVKNNFDAETIDSRSNEEKIKDLIKSSEQKFYETIKTYENSNSSSVIDQYVEKLNKTYEILVPLVKSNTPAIDTTA